MNNTIKLAVASALLAAASSANAGISIPAGDWTLDIGGVVNAYYTHTTFSGDTGAGTGPLGLGAVSYTHLDVYKRQDECWCGRLTAYRCAG